MTPTPNKQVVERLRELLAKANEPLLSIPGDPSYEMEQRGAQHTRELLRDEAVAALPDLLSSLPNEREMELVEALKPFAVVAEAWPAHIADNHCVAAGPYPILLGDLRRARTVLGEHLPSMGRDK